jgi:type II secretory pathway pseudopilin PulG
MIEVVVAIMVLTIGLLSLAHVIAFALTVSNMGRTVTNNKQLIITALEQMENLRNTRQLNYEQIANVGDVDNSNSSFTFAGFPTGFQPVAKVAGADGIYGTSDDTVGAATQDICEGYSREIVITPLSPNLKEIKVTLDYPGPNGTRQKMTGTSYLNNDSRSSFKN